MKIIPNLTLAILLITIVVLQSGCLKENTEYPDVTATTDTIYGTLKYRQTDTAGTTVIDWPFGPATFKAIIGLNDVLSSATVNADGTFMLILPEKVSGSYFSSLTDISDSQGGTIVTTPETIRFLGTIQYKVEYVDKGKDATITTNLHTLKADHSVDKSYFYNFYDMDGSFIGTGSTGNIFNWTFIKGWGIVETYVISSASEAINSKSVSDVPADAVWVN